jgi:cell division protein FtsI (penicillin-binding protein 3)
MRRPGLTDSPNRDRIVLLILTVLALATTIGARLYHLQIQRCDDLRARVKNQAQRTVEVNATRGSILDRHGAVLAMSIATQALYAHPWKVSNPDEATDLLAPILTLPRAEIRKRLGCDKSFVYLDRFLEPERVRQLVDSGLPLGAGNAFGFLPSSRRSYPRGKMGVHVVGFADIDGNGLEGIEQRFDETLRGDPMVYSVVRDGRNGWLSQVALAPETSPQDVVLTVDLELQHIVERELEQAMESTGADAASAVVLDARNGQILALANRPAADPNRFGQAHPGARINRAVVHQYEPGSTFKIVPMAAALESEKVRPSQLFDCENGSLRLGRRTIHDSSPHRLLSASQVMQKSSNIGMVKVVRLLDRQSLYDAIVRFGFGQETGVELPGEQEGAVRSPEQWSTHSMASISFGQEIGVTVLQMSTVFATLANDGIFLPPRVVLGARDEEGHWTSQPKPQGRRVISARVTRELNSMLEGVVARGTGTRAQIDGFRLAGKSGTAQKIVDGAYSDTEFVASFGGFGPLPSPELVTLVVLDSPRSAEYHGGQVAGPVFRRIMEASLAQRRVARDGETLSVEADRAPGPDRWASYESSNPQKPSGSTPAGRVPDLIGLSLREAIARLSARGFRVEARGTGSVTRQEPSPGAALDRGAVCQLVLADPTEATR